MPEISTRNEAEKILGKSRFGNLEFGQYRFQETMIYIDYLRKNLTDNPEKDIVIRIWVYPNQTLKVKDTIQSLSKFKKTKITNDIQGLAYYVDEKEGFAIEVQKPKNLKQEIISAFVYFAPK